MQAIPIWKAAQELRAKPRVLTSVLVKEGVFKVCRQSNQRVPKFEYIEKGIFAMRLTAVQIGDVRHQKNQTHVTPNGLEFLREFAEQHPEVLK